MKISNNVKSLEMWIGHFWECFKLMWIFIGLLQLKESKSDKTVVAFLIFPTKTNSFNVESLRGHAVAKGLKDTIDEIQKEIGVRLYETCLRGAVPDPTDLLSKNDLVKLKRCIFAQGASNLPPITTHNIVEDQNDPVMNAFRRCQLFNNHHDRVKVILKIEKLPSISQLKAIFYEVEYKLPEAAVRTISQ